MVAMSAGLFLDEVESGSGRAGFGCVTTTLPNSHPVRLYIDIGLIALRLGQHLGAIDVGFAVAHVGSIMTESTCQS